MSKKKITIEFLKDEFKKRDYILCEDQYIDAKTKMKYICKIHKDNDLYINWSDFKQGRGCKFCKTDKIGKLSRKDINEVIKMFNSKELILVSTEYKNNKQLLDYYCKKHDFEIQQISVDRLNRIKVSCCKYCLAEYKSEITKGENSPGWKGGVMHESRKLRETLEYRMWRESVFKRDNYTCKRCGKHGGLLQAHHIYSFTDYIDLRYDINNGITLCKECHDSKIKGSFHNIYGTKNYTKEQLLNYINLNKDDEIVHIFDYLDKLIS